MERVGKNSHTTKSMLLQEFLKDPTWASVVVMEKRYQQTITSEGVNFDWLTRPEMEVRYNNNMAFIDNFIATLTRNMQYKENPQMPGLEGRIYKVAKLTEGITKNNVHMSGTQLEGEAWARCTCATGTKGSRGYMGRGGQGGGMLPHRSAFRRHLRRRPSSSPSCRRTRPNWTT